MARVVRQRSRRAFTLIEAAVSLAVTASAGSALLLGMATSLNTTYDVRDKTIAIGLAQQLMDEIVGRRYNGSLTGEGPQQATLGPASSEVAASGSRSLFDDIDDYNNYSSQPPKDKYGIPIGTDNGQGSTRAPTFQTYNKYFNSWKQDVSVYYVSATNVSQKLTSGTSDYRAIEVKISVQDSKRGWRQMASLRRVVSNVPIP